MHGGAVGNKYPRLVSAIEDVWYEKIIGPAIRMFDVHYCKYLTRIENTFTQNDLDDVWFWTHATRLDAVKILIVTCDKFSNGLAFSSPKTLHAIRSQNLLFKAVAVATGSDVVRENTDLTDWARQGVLLVNLHQRRCSGSSFDSGNVIKLLRCVLSALTLYYEHCVDRPISCHVWGSAASALLAVNSSVESDPNNNAMFERDFLAELTLAWTQEAADESLPMTPVPKSSFLINKEYHPFYYEPLVPSSQSICNKELIQKYVQQFRLIQTFLCQYYEPLSIDWLAGDNEQEVEEQWAKKKTAAETRPSAVESVNPTMFTLNLKKKSTRKRPAKNNLAAPSLSKFQKPN